MFVLLHVFLRDRVSHVAVWCGLLECVAVCVCRSIYLYVTGSLESLMCQCVAVCCSVVQYVAVCCSVVQYVAVCCSVLQCGAVCCSVLQCVCAMCR